MVKSSLGCVLLYIGISSCMTEISAGIASSLLPCERDNQCSEMEYCAADSKCHAVFISLGGVFMSDSANFEEFFTDSVATVTSTKYLLSLAILPLTCARLLF